MPETPEPYDWSQEDVAEALNLWDEEMFVEFPDGSGDVPVRVTFVCTAGQIEKWGWEYQNLPVLDSDLLQNFVKPVLIRSADRAAEEKWKVRLWRGE